MRRAGSGRAPPLALELALNVSELDAAFQRWVELSGGAQGFPRIIEPAQRSMTQLRATDSRHFP